MNFSPIANAYAGTAVEGAPGSIFMQIVPLLIIFGIFYFLLIRPQMKKAKQQRQLIGAISKGDEVVTQGGLVGRVMQVGEDYLQLEIAEGVLVKMQRVAVTLLLPKGTLKKL